MKLTLKRDLPLMLAQDMGQFVLPDSMPVRALTMRKGPTPPRPALAEGFSTWRLISQLQMNYLSLMDAEDGEGGAADGALPREAAAQGGRHQGHQDDGAVFQERDRGGGSAVQRRQLRRIFPAGSMNAVQFHPHFFVTPSCSFHPGSRRDCPSRLRQSWAHSPVKPPVKIAASRSAGR